MNKLHLTTNKYSKQIQRYIIAGLINTSVGFFLYSAAIILLAAPFWAATLFAVIGGICSGYFLSRYFVFPGADRTPVQSAYRYALLIIAQYFVSTGLIGVAISFGISDILSYCYALPFIITISFLIQKKWVF